MADTSPIHWHEGLFLQPHHLQSMQRYLEGSVVAQRRLAYAHPYGVVDAKLSPDALENMMVRFDRLRVIMPSGLEVNIPDNTDPVALDIKKAFAASSGALTILLGVPLWYANRANAIDMGSDDWRVKRMYRVVERDVEDENTGTNPQPVMMRRFNARLLLQGDDASDLEVMPLLRIGHATGEDVGLPKQDPEYAPPCMFLSGSSTLRELARDLANQVDASRKELVIQLTRGGFNVESMRGVQLEQMLRLKTLNRFSARLPSIVVASGVTPFEVYLEFRELLAELAALHPDRDQFAVAEYDHDNPLIAFKELGSKIRGMLRGSVAPSFIKVAFARKDDVHVAALTEEHFTRPNEYFLGIKSREDPRAIASLVEDQDKFKLMAESMAHRAIWGIKLTEERHPPLELPSQGGLHYFRLMRQDSQRMWDRIQEEKSLAARWQGLEASDFSIELYMTVPDGGDA